MVNVDNVFFTTVAPSIGILVANIMFLSPFKAVIQVSRDRDIGDLNPIPFPLIFGNCAGWIAYSYATSDPYVYFSNLFGFMLGLFYSVTCYGYATEQMRKFLLSALMIFCGVVAIVGFVGVYGKFEQAAMRTLWGLTANIILVMFYSAPLSSVWSVLRTRNSRLLHWPLAVASVINGTLWVFYGLAMSDGYIWIPNLAGAIFAAFQLLLIFIFPAKRTRGEGGAQIASNSPAANSQSHADSHKDDISMTDVGSQDRDVEDPVTGDTRVDTCTDSSQDEKAFGRDQDDTPFARVSHEHVGVVVHQDEHGVVPQHQPVGVVHPDGGGELHLGRGSSALSHCNSTTPLRPNAS